VGLPEDCPVGVIETHDDCLTAAIEKKISHREAKRAAFPESSKNSFKVPKAVNGYRVINGPRRALPMNAVIDVATPVIVRTPLGISST
jgi:hypothetical protein